MRRWLLLSSIFAVLFLPLPGFCAEPTAQEIATWIEHLGSAKFAEREAASRKLAALDDVPDALGKAIDSANPEVARRAKAAVERIRERKFDRLLKEDLAAVNAVGIDLFIERMLHQPGYATDARWRSLERVVDGMVARAGKLASIGYRKPFEDDCTSMPVHKELSPLAEGGSRLLLDGRNVRYVKMSRCLALCSGSFGRVSTIDRCVMLISGDMDGCASISDSFVLCTGRIGRVMDMQNCIVLSMGDYYGGRTVRNSFFQVHGVERQSRAGGNTYINLKSVPGASAEENKFVESEEGPLSLIKFFDFDRLGLKVKLTEGETRVESIAADSLLGRAGVQKGDAVLSVGDQKCDSPDRLKESLFRALGHEKEVAISLRRSEQRMELTVKTAP
ncbi:MAG TPA: hypothetical protein VGZ47_15050, partial [Gemmataceae bacterium]|nr:hypothetical protein [Gemmataceae bacterium]